MAEKNFFNIALKYAREKGCEIVKPAGVENGWHYYAYTRHGLPRYGSLPLALRINSKGEVETLESFGMRQKVNNMAYALEHSKN